MDHQRVRDTFIDLIDGSLAQETREEIEQHLKECSLCRESFDEYRSVVKLEEIAASRYVALEEDLSRGVMEEITYETVYENACREVYGKTKWLVGCLVSVNIALVAVLFMLVQRQGTVRVEHQSVLSPAVIEQRISERIGKYGSVVPRVPVGYRTVTFTLDSSDGLVDLATADSYVDVHCSYEAGGEKKRTTVGRLLKVLSVNSMSNWQDSSDTTTVTVLASEDDAEKIDLLRVIGDLQLSLFTLDRIDALSAQEIHDPQGRIITDRLDPQSLVVMYKRDPQTGGYVRYVHHGGDWKEETGVEVIAF